MHEIDRTLAAVRQVMDRGRRGVIVTVISTTGSTYRRAGARAVIDEEGASYGMISGGCVERDLAERVRAWLEEPRARLLSYDSTRSTDLLFGLGLGCRGTMELLVEPFDSAHPPPLSSFCWNGRNPVPWTTTFEGREILRESIRPPRMMALFGSGADAGPLVRIAEEAGWVVMHYRSRELPPDPDAFDAAIVMTHNFLLDLALLDVLLPSAVPYVGLLGPRTRGEELLAEASETARAGREKLHSPIGLDLGGETPEEIALSIVAEVQAARNGRSGGPLREKDAAIHEQERVECR